MDGFIKLDNGVDENHLPLIVIIGPTASGKTSLAIQLAKKYRGEIVCADSRTVYRGMNIGTAKPSLGEQQGVSHWGLDLVDPGDSFSVSNLRTMPVERLKKSEVGEIFHFLLVEQGCILILLYLIFNLEVNPTEKRELTYKK